MPELPPPLPPPQPKIPHPPANIPIWVGILLALTLFAAFAGLAR